MAAKFKIFLFGTLLTSLAFAAGEVIPSFNSREEQISYSINVRRQLPFGVDVDRLIPIQIRGLEALRERFPEYDSAMKRKPDPISFEIFKTENLLESTTYLREETYTYVSAAINELFRRELGSLTQSQNEPLNEANLIHEMKKRALENLRIALNELDGPVRGVFTGLATIVPANDRVTYFKLGDVQLQLSFLERIHVSDTILRNSEFRAETLGLDQKSVTYIQVLEKVRQKVTAINKTFIALSYLRALNQTTTISKLAPLVNTDFDFALKGKTDFLEKVTRELKVSKSEIDPKYSDLIATFQDSFSRHNFKTESREVTKQQLFGTVYEVHPHLAVFRGCIGGDCSTSRSPMFPYSPQEHVFYIKNRLGNFAGYATATDVLTDGIPTFYLKDIAGSKLTADLAEAVVLGFSQIYRSFGAQRLALAAPEFTNHQNPHTSIVNMLKNYNSTGTPIEIQFTDHEIRDFIGNNESIFASTSTYDKASVHKRGVLFPDAKPRTREYVFQQKNATLPSVEPKSYPELILEALHTIISDKNMTERDFPWIKQNDLLFGKSLLLNERRNNVLEYYESIKIYLSNLGLKFNHSFLKDHASLLTKGLFNSPDALNSKSQAAVQEVEKAFIQYAKLHTDYTALLQFAKTHMKQLEKSLRFQELLELYKNRLELHDVLQLAFFANFSNQESQKILKDSSNKSRIEQALFRLMTTPSEEIGISNYLQSHRFEIKQFSFIDNEISQMSTADIESHLNQGFLAFGQDWKNTKYAPLREVIELKLLNASDAFAIEYQIINFQRAEILLKKGVLTRGDFVQFTNRALSNNISFGLPELASLIDVRIQQILANKSEVDILELANLDALNSSAAKVALQTPAIRSKYLRLIGIFSARDYEQLTPESQAFVNEFPFLKNKYARTFVTKTYFSFSQIRSITADTSVAAAIRYFETAISELSITAEEFLQIPFLADALTSRWALIKNSFSSGDARVIRFSLELFLKAAKSDALSPTAWGRLISQLKYLVQKQDFHIFINELTIAYNERGCDACAFGLVQFELLGLLKTESLNQVHNLERLLNHKSASVVAYGAYLALLQKKVDLISSTHLENVANISVNGGSEFSSLLKEKLQAISIEVLSHTKSNNEKIQKLLIGIVRNSPFNKVALNAGLAFIAHGGSPYVARLLLTKNYDRKELTEEFDSSETELYSRFLSATRPVSGSGTVYGLSCKFLFVPR